MPADSKIVQSMINHAADAIEMIQGEVIRLSEILASYDALSPDTTGTPMDGKGEALRVKLAQLAELAQDPLLTQIVQSKVPTHRNLL